jgi:RNA polymerase sigma factor (sigma-70 family)
LAAKDKQAFVTGLARDYGQRLRTFLAHRLRAAAAEAPDLMQEVYLRLLRVPSHETIRNPRAYLFTVALHVLHQHRLKMSAQPAEVDIEDVLSELEARDGENPATQLEVRQQLNEFDQALQRLPPQSYVVFVMHRRLGYSRDEIGQQLGLSQAMVKKHLARALAACRRQIESME